LTSPVYLKHHQEGGGILTPALFTLKIIFMQEDSKDHTHFILLYNVPCCGYEGGVRYRRIDYCNTGIRGIEYLKPLLKNGNPSENVAVLKIKFKGGIQFDKYGNPLPASESKPV
jgi:hypothetical protein